MIFIYFLIKILNNLYKLFALQFSVVHVNFKIKKDWKIITFQLYVLKVKKIIIVTISNNNSPIFFALIKLTNTFEGPAIHANN